MRVLNQDTANVLARVERGETVEVTERRVVIAHIVPVHVDSLSDLVASGKLRPATLNGPIPPPRGQVRTEHEAGELMRELRDDERF